MRVRVSMLAEGVQHELPVTLQATQRHQVPRHKSSCASGLANHVRYWLVAFIQATIELFQ